MLSLDLAFDMRVCLLSLLPDILSVIGVHVQERQCVCVRVLRPRDASDALLPAACGERAWYWATDLYGLSIFLGALGVL